MPTVIEASLVRRTSIAHGVYDLAFAVRSPERLDFKAGQFVTIRVPSPTAEGFLKRSYSIASPPHVSGELRFIVREIPGGEASEYLVHVPLGASVPMAGPYGVFVLDEVHPGDVVFGATGTGIAAVLPMLHELAQRPERAPGRRLVFWGLRHEQDVFARQEIEDLCRTARADLSIHLTAPGPVWQGGTGRINPRILEAATVLQTPVFYLVGNGAMITEVKHALVGRGLDRKRQIRTESFFD